MQTQPQTLKEGLVTNDLQEMILNIFEVDTYRSKMGDDRDVCVLSFTAKDRAPARDMMEFIEKGYSFVLDADVSSGENNQGEYTIFVEMTRTPNLTEQIQDLIYGMSKLTNINNWKFKYHSGNSENEATVDNLKFKIPSTPMLYDNILHTKKVESVKHFFNKTLMDDLTIDGDVITIHKHFDKKIQMRLLDNSDSQSVVEGAMSIDNDSMGEIFWLTKVLGDYNINKFEDKLLFTNGNKTLLLQRI